MCDGFESVGENSPPADKAERELLIIVYLGETLEDVEIRMMEAAIRRFGGNKTHAANSIGVSVRTLQRKLKARNAPAASV